MAKEKSKKYKGKTYTASPGSITALEDHEFDVSDAVDAGKFDWADEPYAAAQAAHIVAKGEPIKQESMIRSMIRSILLEKGTHTFHGDSFGPDKVGLPGPQFDDGVAVTAGDLDDAEAYLDEHDPDKLVAFSRGSAVFNKFADEHPDYDLPPEVTYIAPAAKRDKWGTQQIQSPSVSGRAIASSGDGAVPVKQVCQVAKEAGMPAYVVPGKFKTDDWESEGRKNHIRVLKHKNDSAPGKPLDVDACINSDLPDWGSGYADKETLEQQIYIVDELTEAVIKRLLVEAKKKSKKKKKKKKEVKCPLLPNGKRDYKCEYQKYGGASKKGKKDRAARNKARKQAEKMGLVKKGDGLELDHIMPLSLGGGNDQTNWQIMSRTDNRKKGKKWDGKSGSSNK